MTKINALCPAAVRDRADLLTIRGRDGSANLPGAARGGRKVFPAPLKEEIGSASPMSPRVVGGKLLMPAEHCSVTSSASRRQCAASSRSTLYGAPV